MSRAAWLKKGYGITQADYLAMLTAQKGLCAVCGSGPKGKRNLSIDHNHTTGKIRALLCQACNIIVGVAEHPRFPAALAYVLRHQAAEVSGK